MSFDFDIREITKDEALRMVQAYHYSDTLPKINKHFLGCFLGGELVGIVTLGYGTRPRHTIQKIFPSLDTGDYYEIGRMCMTDDMPRNSESQMLSKVCRWIRENEPNIKVLFTWADGSMGKPGYVYQACSFLYAGYITTDFYAIDGMKIHVRSMRALLKKDPNDKRITIRPTREQMREMGIDHYRGRQFKYLKFLCSKKEKKRLLSECLIEFGEYPKESALEWQRYDVDGGKWASCGMPEIRTDDYTDARESKQLSLFGVTA